MAHQERRIARGHLSLACASHGAPALASRATLLARALLMRVIVLVRNLVAVAGALLALAPLLVRRRPLGHRTQVPRAAARVLVFPSRRRASPS